MIKHKERCAATKAIYQDEGTPVFGCKRTSCKRYYNLAFVAAVLYVNVIIIWILDSEGTKVFGCKHTRQC
jgi:hypothetical protein